VLSTEDFENHVINGDFAVHWFNPSTGLALGVMTQELLETSLGSGDHPSNGVTLLPLPPLVVDMLRARRVNFFLVEASVSKGAEAVQDDPYQSGLFEQAPSGDLDEINVIPSSFGWSVSRSNFSSFAMVGAVLAQFAKMRL
jgi:hypothetical protein